MSNPVVEQLRALRRVSTPLVGITTADQPALIASVVKSYAAAENQRPPILQHDIIRGVLGLNQEGKDARAAIVPDSDMPGTPLQSPAEALAAAAGLQARAILFVLNASPLLDNPAVVQAICNLRDEFKSNGRTLVLLSPQLSLPPELVQDVNTIDAPLPNEARIAEIIDDEVKNARETMSNPPDVPSDEDKRRAVEALSGLAEFPVEQSIALSLSSARKLDAAQLWARKRAFIGQTRGLTIDSGGATFDDIGGLENVKTFGRALFAGRVPPRAIVRIDEIEKMLGGAAADTSGVSQDALGTILREMEDQNWAGLIGVGPPGSGKTIFSQTLGNTHGAPTFALDLGAAKGSLVGQSEERIRAALKTIKAVAQMGAFFVATCNKLDALPPELRRRFRYGLWFFDLPTAEERAAIWAINVKRYEITPEQLADKPADTDWTGAEVRNVCELAWRMKTTIKTAAAFIVPVSVSDPEAINKLRSTAAGKFLSASYAGPYKHPKAVNYQPAERGRDYRES